MYNLPTEVIDFKPKSESTEEFTEVFFPLPKLLYSERAVLELLCISRHKLIKSVNQDFTLHPGVLVAKRHLGFIAT
jgi:hypothetical protein